jgi:16S rRNA (adenine1518-N6/adenine1519-N6)-dimethyltransferase
MDFKYYGIKEIRNFLNGNNINCQKKFGQNFLIDEKIADTIIKSLEIDKTDLVIEIGCGIGSLTNKILNTGCRMIGYEIDWAFIKFLKEYFKEDIISGKFELIEGDFLKESVLSSVKKENYRSVKLVGNLPYYITKPVIEKIFTTDLEFDLVCIMIQKEVADKLRSKENSKKYSYLSILSQVNKEMKSVCEAGPESFYPSPEVDSEVVLFSSKMNKSEISDYKMFCNLSKSLFLNRRKKIMNNLNFSPFFNQKEKELLKKILCNLNISDNLRGENIPVEDIIRISNELYRCLGE